MVYSISSSKPLFLLLFFFLCQPFDGVAEDGSSRRPFGSINNRLLHNKPIPNCGELVLKSQCSQNSKCSWCTSQDLDDMCFSKPEAFRLPHQVFSCGSIR